MGKSSLAVNMAVNAAEVRPDLRRLQLGDDQGAAGHASPGLGGRDRLPPPQAGPLLPLGGGRIIDSIGRLSDLPVFIDDTPYQGMAEMRSKARRLALERGLDLLVVDYLQLVQGKQSGGSPTGCRRSPRSPAS